MRPAPKAKEKTRWEKFAEQKGIKKRKRESKLAYDEATDSYLPRFGYGRADSDTTRDWVRELKPHEAWPAEGEDPFTKTEREKKERVAKQKKREERNVLEAAQKSTIGLAAKALGKVPIKKEVIRDQAKKAFTVAQVSTGSMGKFDAKVNGEKKVPIQRGNERKEGLSRASLTTEKSKNISVLERLFSKEELIDKDRAVKVHHRETTNRVARAREEMGTPSKASKKGGKKARGAGGGGKHKFQKTAKGRKSRA
jgi:regulator of ribosome biosynthesis